MLGQLFLCFCQVFIELLLIISVWFVSFLFSAMLSDSQRKGLEKRFQMQKYISKPDRKKLAERLGLKDSQVIILHFSIHSV